MLRSLVKITMLLGIVGVGVWVLYEAQQKLNHSGAIVAGIETPEIPNESPGDSESDGTGAEEPFGLASNENSQTNPFENDTAQNDPQLQQTGTSTAQSGSQQKSPFYTENDTGDLPAETTEEPMGLEFRDKITSVNETNDASTNSLPQVVENTPPLKIADAPEPNASDSFESQDSFPTTPRTLRVPKSADEIPASDGGPQLVSANQKAEPKPVEEPDIFGAEPLPDPISKPSAGKQEPILPVADESPEVAEDPFGGFEEQAATPPRKLSLPNEKRPAPLPIFPESPAEQVEVTPARKIEKNEPAADGTVVVKQRQSSENISKSAFDESPNTPEKKNSTSPAQLVMEPRDDGQVQPLFQNHFKGTGTINKPVPRGADHPRLTIEKIAPANAVLGQPMIYSIVIRNKGKSKANKVVVEDRVPKGTDLDGTIPRAELTDHKLIWKLGSLAPGEEQTIRVRVIPRTAGQIGSIATVNFVSEIAAETNITAPSLKIELSGPRSASVGEPVLFQFRVTNSGNADAKDVIIRNIIPSGLSHPDGNDLEYELGTLPAGKSQEIKLAMKAVSQGEIENKAIVTAAGGIQQESTTQLRVEGPLLKISRIGPKRRYVGRTVSFKNDISNESREPIQLATITETIPAEYNFQRASGGGTYNEQSRQVIWQISQLPPGQSKRLEVLLTCKSQGKAASQVTAVVDNIVRAEVGSETIIEGYPKLQTVVAGAEEPVAVGEQVTYKIDINNKGTADAHQVRVDLTVPPQLQFLSVNGAKATALKGNKISLTPISRIGSKKQTILSVTFKAVAEGEGYVGVHAQGKHMSRALTHEERVIVYNN